MCGIAGVVWADPLRPVERATLERMGAALAHRGPDGEGNWIGAGVGLAHRRLNAIDLSIAGRQPMPNEDGSVLAVFNGETYNFAELRAELEAKGHRFRSRTDTEVLVHLYEEHGDAAFERLEGMFAFGLWDAQRRRLLLARDRVGKKPLKYAELAGGGIAFASELKALFAAGLAEVRAAVQRRLVSDVPLGAFLSGGIDSSIVVACMAEASTRPVETFSIGFEHELYDELPYARLVAQRFATSHHEFRVQVDHAHHLARARPPVRGAVRGPGRAALVSARARDAPLRHRGTER